MDRNTLDELKAHLMQTNDEYRHLARQHQKYDTLVEALEQKPVLTAEEELEEHRLKKFKLHLKDMMEQMVIEHSGQGHQAVAGESIQPAVG